MVFCCVSKYLKHLKNNLKAKMCAGVQGLPMASTVTGKYLVLGESWSLQIDTPQNETVISLSI
jgi:hypothetical protein